MSLDKFREMWRHKLSRFDHNPRGFKEMEGYLLLYGVKVFYHRRLKTNLNKTSVRGKLIIGEGEVGFDYDCVDIEYVDGLYNYLVPREFMERCLILGYVP